ncbi:hypothetical protein [Haloferax sp. DFSO60]|uniref:hypothetical protein n=1 Tax=Haloferax sp. DFSO60 TaxID=3388652 RepID=UPI00397B4862
MSGQLNVERGASPHETYHDVQVVLYDANKERIESFPVGTLSTDPAVAPGKIAVNITTEATPTYVLVESPDFWKTKKGTYSRAYMRSDGRFEPYLIKSQEEKFSAE